MQLYDLNPQILESIFTASINKEVLAQYTEWHQNLDPSFKLLKHMLTEYLTAGQGRMLKVSAKIILQLFQKFVEFRFPRTFVRAYLSILQENMKEVSEILKIQELIASWKVVHIDLLECYLSAFDIQLQGAGNNPKESKYLIRADEIETHIFWLIDRKEYESAIKVIKLINYPHRYLDAIFTRMASSKLSSKAASLMKTHGIDSTLYPQINKGLSKSMIRYFLMSVGWDAAEEIFSEQPDALWNLIDDLVHKKMEKEAISVFWRNRNVLCTFQGITEEQKKLKNEWVVLDPQLLENPYFVDYFGPSDKEKYASLAEFGVQQQQVHILDNQESITRFVEAMQHAQICAIDTESIVGKTKLDKKKEDLPSIIQVALQKEVFIIDCLHRDERVKQSMFGYLSSDRLLLGHALENDLEGVLLGLGLPAPQRKIFKFGNVVDTCKLFKAIYPQQRHSNLSHISQKVLGRQICKKQTLTNWARRPLRQNQIHYAALDALIVVHIFLKLQEQVGPNMLSYFLGEI